MRRSQHSPDLRNRWAQQGSNLRPLACMVSSYRRWTWLDVARCGICQPGPWLDVAWRGLMPVDVGSPFGSPISLAPLTFGEHGRQPETRYWPSAMANPGRPMTVSPTCSHEGPEVALPADTST